MIDKELNCQDPKDERSKWHFPISSTCKYDCFPACAKSTQLAQRAQDVPNLLITREVNASTKATGQVSGVNSACWKSGCPC